MSNQNGAWLTCHGLLTIKTVTVAIATFEIQG